MLLHIELEQSSNVSLTIPGKKRVGNFPIVAIHHVNRIGGSEYGINNRKNLHDGGLSMCRPKYRE